MTQYVVFLRGVNVGGHALIKMDTLKETFESLKLDHVITFIQSGNVLFESEEDKEKLKEKIQTSLFKKFKLNIETFLIKKEELVALVKKDPFKEFNDLKVKRYVLFVNKPIEDKELIFDKEEIEILYNKNNILCCLLKEKNGKYTYPTLLLEKKLKLLTTTRNWNVIKKIVAL